MAIEEYTYYYYSARCDGCGENPGHVKETQTSVERLILFAGWKIWEIPATNLPGDPESFLVILCPKCAA